MSSTKLCLCFTFFRQGDLETTNLLLFGASGFRVRKKIWKQKFHGMKHQNVAVRESKLICVILGFLGRKKALIQILKFTSIGGTGVKSSGHDCWIFFAMLFKAFTRAVLSVL